MALVAKSLISLIALGALFLNEAPKMRLWRWMVYSRATTSARADRPGLEDLGGAISTGEIPNQREEIDEYALRTYLGVVSRVVVS
jgi:hypothetical protein